MDPLAPPPTPHRPLIFKRQPFRPVLADLDYADVDGKDYGPVEYKRASTLAAAERKALAEADALGVPVRPPPRAETRL